MRDRKLYDLLRRLSADERALFAEFLRSPLHAHRPKLADMVELMERLLFAAPEHPCSSEDFYAAFYPGKPYDSNNLNRLISVITSEFKEFLALRFFQRDRTARTACATREMSRRRWDDILPKEIALTRKVLQEELPDDEHNYYQLYCLEYENARHYMENDAKKGDLVYQALIKKIEKNYRSLMRKMKCFASIYDTKFNTAHEFYSSEISFGELLPIVEPGSICSKLYALAFQLISNSSSKETYETYLSAVESDLPYYDDNHQPIGLGKVNKVDAEALLSIAQNAASIIARSEPGFQHEQQLRIVGKGIEKGILLEEGFLNRKSFENYIKTAAVLGKIQEAWGFLNRYSSLLHPKEDQITNLLTSGFLHIMERRPLEASRVLLRAKSILGSNPEYNDSLENRTMLCIAWYEMQEIDQLSHEANAMRAYITRYKVISKQTTLTYRRFLKAISAIEKAERKPAEKKREKYKKVLWNLEFLPKFTYSRILRRDIIDLYGPEMEYWRQDDPGANNSRT